MNRDRLSFRSREPNPATEGLGQAVTGFPLVAALDLWGDEGKKHLGFALIADLDSSTGG